MRVAKSCVFAMMLAAGLLCVGAGAAQRTIPVDSRDPPSGFSPPAPDGARDLSMAKHARESFLEGEEGIVHLRVLILRDGSVADSQVEKSSGSARLDKYAQDLVKGWRYQPGKLDGDPVDAWIPVNIVWALQTLPTESPPGLVKVLATYWPPEAVALHQQGNTTLQYLVSRDGTVSKVVVARSSGYPLLDRAAVRAVSRFHFDTAAFTFDPGVWFRIILAWRTRESEFREPCFGNYEAVENRILECTDHLLKPNLPAYERASTYELLGDAHARIGEYDVAISDYNAGVAAAPGLEGLFIGRGKAYLAIGKRDLASSDFDTAVQVWPLAYEGYVARGGAYLERGEKERATTDFNKALQIPTANQPGALNAVCYELAKRGSAGDALAYCNKSLELRPANVNTLDSRGYTYFRLGAFDRAIADYDTILATRPRFARALYSRGIAKVKMGDPSAEADLNGAQKIDPGIGRQMAEIGVTP